MVELNNTITLVVGDYSHDGHGITANVIVQSNFSQLEITTAYELGVKILGIDLCENVCSEYEDQTIKFSDFKKFLDAGYSTVNLNKDDLKSIKLEKDIEYVDDDLFAELYLFTVYIGNKNFEYNITVETNNINIGGYGLLGN